jgi:hypothetical protein
MRTALAIAATCLLLSACRAPYAPISIVQEYHPEEPWADVRVEAKGRVGDYLMTIWLTNLTDEYIEISPGCFFLEDADGRPFEFVDWAYFGHHRWTPHTPRPLPPRATMHGLVRFYSRMGSRAYLLRVILADEEHAFELHDPYARR